MMLRVHPRSFINSAPRRERYPVHARCRLAPVTHPASLRGYGETPRTQWRRSAGLQNAHQIAMSMIVRHRNTERRQSICVRNSARKCAEMKRNEIK